MCGICGAVDFSGALDPAEFVRRMTPAMRHRGPDDEGYLSSRPLAIGMRRLSIIDIEGGHQPIFNEDGSIGAVLNGEIYNFRELTNTLKGLGHRFRTRSDSEVIAHAYEQWGPGCVQRLQGMFAVAVYDSRRAHDTDGGGTLFLARDRLGIKPLYYYCGPSAFLFASEVRTLLASGVIPKQLSRSSLHSFLLFGSVSEPMTLVEGVLSLPPGHSITIDLGSPAPAIQPQPYWDIAAAAHPNGDANLDRQAATARVRELLEESVRLHLIADVPVGIFLSGGIDSTAIAALASREVSGVHTFTVDFPEKQFSEADIARRTAKRFGAAHDELMLDGDEMVGRVGEAVAALDQPSMDGINSYFVSWAARKAGLKVALSGTGGDEVFGGYQKTFRWTPRYERLAAVGGHVPSSVRAAMASVLSGAGDTFARGDGARKIAALWDDPRTLPHPYFFARALFTPTQVARLMSGGAGDSGQHSLWWQWLAKGAADANQLDSFSAVTCLEARSYLVNTLLRDLDSMSMAHSLEVRVPFLHHPLVEFVTRLPAAMKVGRAGPKELLVAALADLLPAEVVQQPKRGFTFPWAEWLRGPLREKMERGLSELSPSLGALLDERSVHAVWQAYLENKTSWSRPWSLYVLNEWVKRHVDGEAVDSEQYVGFSFYAPLTQVN